MSRASVLRLFRHGVVLVSVWWPEPSRSAHLRYNQTSLQFHWRVSSGNKFNSGRLFKDGDFWRTDPILPRLGRPLNKQRAAQHSLI